MFHLSYEFSVQAVDDRLDSITNHDWKQLRMPQVGAKMLADEICVAHPAFYPEQIKGVRNWAITHPTISNLMVFDQVVTMIFNCPQWGEKYPMMYTTCLSKSRSEGMQLICTCPSNWDRTPPEQQLQFRRGRVHYTRKH